MAFLSLSLLFEILLSGLVSWCKGKSCVETSRMGEAAVDIALCDLGILPDSKLDLDLPTFNAPSRKALSIDNIFEEGKRWVRYGL